MQEIVTRMLALDAQAYHPLFPVIIGSVWLILLIATFSSLKSLKISIMAKIIWFTIVLALPIVGLALYCLWCILRSDWSFLKPMVAAKNTISKGTATKQS